jgi:integrase
MRTIGKLTPRKVATATPPKGKRSVFLQDGGNLKLQVSLGPEGNVRKSWVFAYELSGKRRFMGLGPLHAVSLKDARRKAHQLRGQLVDKIDPLIARRKQRQAALVEAAKAITFEQCAADYLDLHGDGWSEIHLKQWKNSLKNYAYPRIGKLSPADIDSSIIMQMIEPHWKRRTVTASRVLDRIGLIFDYAKTKGYRTGDNPARETRAALPDRATLTEVKHFPAMPPEGVPSFLATLRTHDTDLARALEFHILTTSRPKEVRFATWSEIDFAERLWTRPANHMKGGRIHIVPLTDRMIEILRATSPGGPRDRIFPYGVNAFGHFLDRVKPKDVEATPHGFRSSFKQWTRKRTRFPRDVVEIQLDHKIAKAVEDAYARDAEMFEERVALVNAWSTFCTSPPEAKGDNVVAIGEGRRS